MVRRTLVAIGATTLLLVALAGQALAHPPTHLHCLTTPGGTHAIARGVTLHAPHDPAFHNLHFTVHSEVFADHPLGPLVPDFGPTFECP